MPVRVHFHITDFSAPRRKKFRHDKSRHGHSVFFHILTRKKQNWPSEQELTCSDGFSISHTADGLINTLYRFLEVLRISQTEYPAAATGRESCASLSSDFIKTIAVRLLTAIPIKIADNQLHETSP